MNTTKRIEYIDALRGLTMLLVVTGHIYSMSFMHEKFNEYDLSYNNFFELFLMPLFFFISGFVFYKSDRYWNYITIKEFIINKVRILLFSALVFFLLFCVLYQKEIVPSLFDVHKSGYWFTYVLFTYFVLYIGIDKMICSLGQTTPFSNYTIISSIIVGLLLYILISNGFLLNILPPSKSTLLSINKWHYFLFFSFGCLIHKYYHSFWQLLNIKYLKDGLLILFVCMTICMFFQNCNHVFIHNYTLKLFIASLGITLTVILFKENEVHLSNSTKAGNCLQHIGKHTLDIYFLHFYFLPYNMSFVGAWLGKYPNPLLEFCLSLTLALIVIVCCLIVSKIIRLSPTLAYLLLGTKRIIRI